MPLPQEPSSGLSISPAEAPRARYAVAFSLLELLTAMAVFITILALVFSVMNGAVGLWQGANSKIDAFQNARTVFDTMTSRLSEATLNTYWDYYDAAYQPFRKSTASSSFIPKFYGRYSDLAFVCGSAAKLLPSPPPNCSALAGQAVFFIAPAGLTSDPDYRQMPELLNACGYFIAFSSDEAIRPKALEGRPLTYRWRLMELTASTESLQVFGASTGAAWFADPIASGEVRPIADNVIALIVWPRGAPFSDPDGAAIAPEYQYDSRTGQAWTNGMQPVQAHQLPPTVQLTMVTIDEPSARRLQDRAGSASTPPQDLTDAMAGLFSTSAPGSVQSYSSDLQTLEERLRNKRINYRTFTTTIAMPESRWSQMP